MRQEPQYHNVTATRGLVKVYLNKTYALRLRIDERCARKPPLDDAEMARRRSSFTDTTSAWHSVLTLAEQNISAHRRSSTVIPVTAKAKHLRDHGEGALPLIAR